TSRLADVIIEVRGGADVAPDEAMDEDRQTLPTPMSGPERAIHEAADAAAADDSSASSQVFTSPAATTDPVAAAVQESAQVDESVDVDDVLAEEAGTPDVEDDEG